jgi:syntaxin-binding protein 1
MRFLGVNMGVSKKPKKLPKAELQQKRADIESQQYGDRYCTVIKGLTQQFATGTLSEDDFPYVVPPPESAKPGNIPKAVSSLRKNKASMWGGAKKAHNSQSQGARSLVFVLGGASYSELRDVDELQATLESEIVFGSTAMLTADEFMGQLGQLDSPSTLGEISLSVE